MSLAEKWKQLSGKTKMVVIGGGGVALFFLFSAIKGKNSQQSQAQQDTSVGPQQAAIDPTSWIDTQTQQMQSMQQAIGGINDSLTQYEQSNQQVNQQNMQALQDVIQQNQQVTQQQISSLVGSMATAPTYPSTTGPAPSPKTTAPTKSTVTTKKSPTPTKTTTTKAAAPTKTTAKETITVKSGDNLWNIAKSQLKKGSSNAAIQKEVNVLAKSNHIANPSLINVGQKISISK